MHNGGNANYKSFNTPEQLSRYSSVSKRDGKAYDLRYNGQSVALVTCTKKKGIILKPNIENARNFGFLFDEEEIKSETVEWEWKKSRASSFRSFFKNKAQYSENYSQPEHRLENRLLRLFTSKEKPFRIQPVRLYNCFFQMPTPLSASKHEELPKYSRDKGGGIDILSRFTPRDRVEGENSRLCVMELKDEIKKNENQDDAIGQAIAYAVFIAKLLRSESGQDWWNFFMNREEGNQSDKSTKLRDVSNVHDIEVVTIMPWGETEEFCNQEVKLQELGITLHCHSLYYDDSIYKKGKGKIQFIKGSFIEEVILTKK